MRRLCVGPLFLFSSLLVAGETAVPTLDPIIITATRTAQTADESLASVTVITRNDIERQQAQSVQDLLRGVPGLAMSNNGGAGKATSIFLRGTESDHVLVIIDGIKVGSATSGTFAFQDIPVEQIERIEIVRGPRSSLYGSEAIGGVIQIFTRKGDGAGGFKPFFSVGAGSYQTYNTSAGVTASNDKGWFSLAANAQNTEGFNACAGILSAACFTVEPDKDGYRNTSTSLRAGYRFDSGLEIDAHALRSNSNTEFDGGFVNESTSVQQVLGTTLRYSPMDIWQSSLAIGRSRDDSDNFKDGAYKTRFNTERDTISWQNDISIGGGQLLTLGVDYQDDKVDSSTAYVINSRDNKGFFAQYQGMFNAHDLQLSLRRDDNEQFGGNTTGGLAWGYALNNDTRLTASYGTGFKAPTFNELYWPADPVWGGGGNPALQPEKSRSLELGITGRASLGRWALNVYETRIKNLISGWPPVNVNDARIRGLEAVLGTQLIGWDVDANLGLLDTENRAVGANFGNVLPRRAKQSLRVDVNRQFGLYRFGASLFAEGKRYDDTANTRRLGGYATLDLRAEYLFVKDWRVQARIENLLDKDYNTAAFYNQPGRGLYVTLRYQP
ncbi:MAG: TonB-dependent vitamin B12 receptor [Gammaproteobacteria bacterium]|nr:TonB-dependent vitamin B12 receptor [Gammaproteobacteria bacterium]